MATSASLSSFASKVKAAAAVGGALSVVSRISMRLVPSRLIMTGRRDHLSRRANAVRNSRRFKEHECDTFTKLSKVLFANF